MVIARCDHILIYYNHSHHHYHRCHNITITTTNNSNLITITAFTVSTINIDTLPFILGPGQHSCKLLRLARLTRS